MTDQSWQDRIVGDRMAVDQEFGDRVDASEFSRQQWSLIMTAVTFRVEDATDEEAARLVGDTSKLPDVLPELDNVDTGMPGMGGGQQPQREGGGLLGGIKSALGLAGGDDDMADEERLEAAAALVQEYATELQNRLEKQGRWGEVRAAAAAAEADPNEATQEEADGAGDPSAGV